MYIEIKKTTTLDSIKSDGFSGVIYIYVSYYYIIYTFTYISIRPVPVWTGSTYANVTITV